MPIFYLLFCCQLTRRSRRKSTFSLELERTSSEGWVRISQDDLGSADECKKQMEKVGLAA